MLLKLLLMRKSSFADLFGCFCLLRSSCGHVDEPPPEGWQLPAILSASATNMSMRGVADVSSESDAEVSSDDDDDESIEVSDDDDDEEVMSETEEENDEKFHVNPEDITYRELRTYGCVLYFFSWSLLSLLRPCHN